MLDFFLCLIWLPIGVSKTYGFRTAGEAFTSTCTSGQVGCVRNANLSLQSTEPGHHLGGIGCYPCASVILSSRVFSKLLFISLFTAGTLTGFDASGHIAEETKNATVVAARGILSSAIATGVLGFITTVLFLFCTPDLDTLFALEAPQPFVQIYAMALGKGGCVVMTIIATIGLIMVRMASLYELGVFRLRHAFRTLALQLLLLRA